MNMEYSDLLGTPLKNDTLMDLFETYDVDVIYRYDRNHENMDDEYVAEIPEMGLEFLFDSEQNLTTVFMRHSNHSGFNPFQGKDPRLVPFKSGVDAMKYAQDHSIDAKHSEAKSDEIFGEIAEWVKFRFGSFYIHYQFINNTVDVVTLQASHA